MFLKKVEQSNYPVIFLKSQRRTSQGTRLHESPEDTEVLPSSKTLGYNWHFCTSQERESKVHKCPGQSGCRDDTAAPCSACSACLPQLQPAYSQGRSWKRRTYEGRRVRRECLWLRCLRRVTQFGQMLNALQKKGRSSQHTEDLKPHQADHHTAFPSQEESRSCHSNAMTATQLQTPGILGCRPRKWMLQPFPGFLACLKDRCLSFTFLLQQLLTHVLYPGQSIFRFFI